MMMRFVWTLPRASALLLLAATIICLAVGPHMAAAGESSSTTNIASADPDLDDRRELQRHDTLGIYGQVLEDINGDGMGDAPLSGVLVNIHQDKGDRVYGTGTRSDAEGYYFLYPFDIDAGDYTVSLTYVLPPYPLSSVPMTFQGTSDGTDTFTSGPHDFVVTTGRISGTIWEKDANGAGSGNDRPLSGVIVKLMEVTTADGLYSATTVSDNDGLYSFVNFPAGNYTLYTNSITLGFLPLEESAPLNYTLTFGGDITQPTVSEGNDFFVIVGVATVLPRPASISGRILEDTNGDGVGDIPVSGIRVALVGVGSDDYQFTITDANGYYVFEGFLSDDYYINPNGEPFDSSGVYVLSGSTPISISFDGVLPFGSFNNDFIVTRSINPDAYCSTSHLEEGVDYRIVPRHDTNLALSVQGDSIVLRAKGMSGKDQIWSPRLVRFNYYHFVNAANEMNAINVAGASLESQVNIISWPLSTPNNSANDDWCLQMVPDDSNSFHLIAAHILQAGGYGMIMDVAGAGRSDGTNIMQYARGPPDAFHQQFQFEKVVPEDSTCKVCVSPVQHETTTASLQALVDDLTSQLNELSSQRDSFEGIVNQRLSALEGLATSP